MNSSDDRKRLAAARKAARIQKIRTIRSGVAAAGVSLAIAFSTVIAERTVNGSAASASTSPGKSNLSGTASAGRVQRERLTTSQS
ncbi:MAG: hypothetical protein ACSLFD_09675 [Solirubrobacterales bacterium]